MFYCESCRKKRSWPTTFSRSYGRCEICGCTNECHDKHSSQLPLPKDSDDFDPDDRYAKSEKTKAKSKAKKK